MQRLSHFTHGATEHMVATDFYTSLPTKVADNGQRG